MTAAELIEMLEELDPETEIRLMTQPAWPFEWSLRSRLYQPTDVEPCAECGSDMIGRGHDDDCGANFGEDESSFRPTGAEGQVAYLIEGSQLGYGTKSAWNE